MSSIASTLKEFLNPYYDRRVLVMALIGYSCGIPLLLTASTLSLWLKQVGLSNTQIGAFSLCALPYAVKFLWAPFIDRLSIPYLTKRLGRRRSWLFLSQIALIGLVSSLGTLNPQEHLGVTVVLALLISFASATQDVAMLAYQVERLGKNQYGSGEAMGICGYRFGMLTSGAGALYLADSFDWHQVYWMMALLIGVGLITTLCMQEPALIVDKSAKDREDQMSRKLQNHKHLNGWKASLLSWLYGAVVAPFSDFVSRTPWILVLLIMVFYKLGDNLIGNMSNIFFSDLGYTKSEIASASKVFGMMNTILGGFIGGILIAKRGVVISLFASALIHGLSILFYVWMAKVGYSIELLYVTMALEHMTGGMRTTSLFAYQMTVCTPIYAATQLALLTSCVHFGRTVTAAFSGWLVDALGWVNFFNLAAASTIISLILVLRLVKIEHEAWGFRSFLKTMLSKP